MPIDLKRAAALETARKKQVEQDARFAEAHTKQLQEIAENKAVLWADVEPYRSIELFV